MDILYDILMGILVLILIALIILRMHKKLLRLWKEVSYREIIFHRLLNETIVLFYSKKDELKNDDNRVQFIRLGRSKKKKARYLLLKERQNLFQCLSDIYNEIDELESKEFQFLINKFKELQKARRIYNSKVLLYNQTISVFPTRYLAIKMNLKIKEYFGQTSLLRLVFL